MNLPDLSYPQYHQLNRDDQDRFIAMLASDESFLILYERMKEQGDRFDSSLIGLDALLESSRARHIKEGIDDVFKTVQIAVVQQTMESEEDE